NTQRPELYYYEGTVWYRKRFRPDFDPGKRQFLHFGAANYEAIVWLNGERLGSHTGGFTPFNFEVTGKLRDGENSLVVKVDNKRRPEGVPTVNADWWNYGGLTRPVTFIETPATFIRDYGVQMSPQEKNKIECFVQVDGPAPADVLLEIPELNISHRHTLAPDGMAEFSIRANPERWSPANPKLYEVRLISGTDTISDHIGFRTIRTDGTKLMLNDEEIFCRGISIHEERPYDSGRAWSDEHASTLLGWAKDMGCNFVRLAHYPHNENMVRMAESMGLMVWSEIPVYWTIHWDNPDTYANSSNQLNEMITRDRNRCNIIIWSIANETPRSDSRLKFLANLASEARALDRGARLIGAAMEKDEVSPGVMSVNDPLEDILDIISFNEYIGWYDGTPEKCDRSEWTFRTRKPVFISEWGGGALYGKHGDATHRFTEEYQEDLYRHHTRMLDRIPGLAGCTPWILKDFRSPRRHLPRIQDDFNRKGLISDKGERKKAFYVMKDWYGRKAAEVPDK
ncbi:MAG: beta galactosidase jelly roll domain-containing protein, partial [Muribaculaceae bacterium]|nr:beta galactosidase jelly roll domain-containing protein [Muribaculaceae bacterium]